MTELMEIDQLAINRVNPYTATNTFGVSYNGGYKSTEALPWMLPREESTAEEDSSSPEYLDHFDPKVLYTAPAAAGMTGSVDPATSFMFPARKYQYDDGTTSWSREVVYTDGRNYISFGGGGRRELWPVIIALVLLVIVLAFRKKLNL